ncbi:hypothetical protein BD310DRAFT_128043 [Dichomitus squalens]|uniref:BTB domain-containing protein n=1 Tax=Dichomitus squalens TaxID=114155 RepID=A0A4Q9PIE4_9APHY|nr:hypothetical protein BD310DRAFT_128043 [Dichomitus squalens]
MKPSRPASPLLPHVSVSETASLKRDEEFWFEDGNLILVAGDVEFRVYQGPLIAHSPVFNDMLSLPQPAEDSGRRTRHGESSCPIIPLTDSPEDLRHFLRVFVSSSSGKIIRSGQHDPTFHEVSACVRLGHKYQVDGLVQRYVDLLRKYYADNFDAWYRSTLVRPPSFQAVHSIAVVNLARLTNTPSMLPTALMDCCTLGPEIVDGLVREDGTRETLPLDDLGRCFVGRAKMAQASARIAHLMFRPPVSAACRQPACCQRVLQRLLNELGNARDDVISCVDWYASWMVYVDGRDEDRELCMRCYKMLEGERPKKLQREVWMSLPAMMGVTVEGWGIKAKQES